MLSFIEHQRCNPMNHLYYGDNLDILRLYVKDESVDLIYLDPPFNSKRDYNAVFSNKGGGKAAAQVQAFEDTWRWDESAARAYDEVIHGTHTGAANCLKAFRDMLGTNDMLAYLSMMAVRLVELRRVLKSTGSIYLHCDPTMSHYLKLLMDSVFGSAMFRTEIIWQRTTAHNDAKQGRRQHGRIHDVILFYTKSQSWTWNNVYTAYDEEYVAKMYRYIEPETGRRYQLDNLTGPGGASKGNPEYEVMGVTRFWRYSKSKMEELISAGRIVQASPGSVPRYKRYLDEMHGIGLQDLWCDIRNISSRAAEALGYPTQKPIALLERILLASSNEGDVVLDPFCGCGTTITAAQKLNRKWIGIDVTHLAVNLMRSRLIDAFGDEIRSTFKVVGEPATLEDAEHLALVDNEKYQFQFWALGLVGARPESSSEKKGADRGIDGKRFFSDDINGKTKTIIISVKGGKSIPSTAVRDLRGTMEREGAEIAVLISLVEPTKAMREDAAAADLYTSPYGSKHPRIQLLTVAQLLDGKGIDMPSNNQTRGDVQTLKRAQRQKRDDSQSGLGL